MKGKNRLLFITLLFLAAGAGLFAAVPIQRASLGNLSAGNARLNLLAAAEAYLGTPYRYGGLDSRGLDCSGLVYMSFMDSLKIAVPRTAGGLYSWAEKIPTADMRPGDLVFFITTGPGVSHVGIYVGSGQFIHAPSEGARTGVTYSRLEESYWKRTFAGAGRALPWDDTSVFLDEQSGQVTAANVTVTQGAAAPGANSPGASTPAARVPVTPVPGSGVSGTAAAAINRQPWTQSKGFMAGIGLNASLGGFVDGTVFRGIGLQARLGYKGLFNTSLQAAVEMRPEWDRFLGIYRLPITLSLGNDTFQIFAGPAITIGEPTVDMDNQRAYYSAFSWLGEVGVSTAFKPIEIFGGGLSFFAELAWQPYFSKEKFHLGADLAANLRTSVGCRYSWLAGK